LEYGYYKYTEYYYSKTVSRKRVPDASVVDSKSPEVTVRAGEADAVPPVSTTTANGSAGGPPAITVKKA